MDTEVLYDLVHEAVGQALDERLGSKNYRLSNRMLEGTVTFTDGEGRVVKDMPVAQFFKKVTGVREKLRVLEQKVRRLQQCRVSVSLSIEEILTSGNHASGPRVELIEVASADGRTLSWPTTTSAECLWGMAKFSIEFFWPLSTW